MGVQPSMVPNISGRSSDDGDIWSDRFNDEPSPAADSKRDRHIDSTVLGRCPLGTSEQYSETASAPCHAGIVHCLAHPSGSVDAVRAPFRDGL